MGLDLLNEVGVKRAPEALVGRTVLERRQQRIELFRLIKPRYLASAQQAVDHLVERDFQELIVLENQENLKGAVRNTNITTCILTSVPSTPA
jgi:hypothetical protein